MYKTNLLPGTHLRGFGLNFLRTEQVSCQKKFKKTNF